MSRVFHSISLIKNEEISHKPPPYRLISHVQNFVLCLLH